jgi:hypothetical protein
MFAMARASDGVHLVASGREKCRHQVGGQQGWQVGVPLADGLLLLH